MVTPDQLKARATPGDAEIAAAYKAAGTRFAAAEKRTLSQVVVADQAAANALAAAVKVAVAPALTVRPLG